MYSNTAFLLGISFAVVALTIAAKECRDNPLVAKECHLLRKSFGDPICKTKYYSIRKLMHDQCKATCSLCSQNGRALAPPIPCHKSMFGCCWDRVTTALDRGGKGCPPCINRHKGLCRMFRWMCNRKKINADYIKMNCPVTCGRCRPDKNAEIGPSIFHFYASSTRKLWRHKKNKSRRHRRRF